MLLLPREGGRTTALSHCQGRACRRRVKPRTSPSLEQRAKESTFRGEREGAVVQREAAAAVTHPVAAVDDGSPGLAAPPCLVAEKRHCRYWDPLSLLSSEPGAIVVT
ncbi:uncharacterized protein LOC110265919 [Arachis ipaensis]|uniref:uncharacterized protein LOC110265919 n=1 Tax=Arachis ipaensis TaxID=130454 RepID=UPI000A2B4A1D|nr:uncharacterized protein LOC110265919 [Arachis ipaensis]